MATDPVITAEECRQLVAYDPETGNLTWKLRPLSFFNSEADAAKWNGRFPGKAALNIRSSRGYRSGALFGKTMFAHRVAWAVFYGEWPSDQIDHINGDKSDNRISNLRVVSVKENTRNKALYKNAASDVPGVWYEAKSDKWRARVGDVALGSYFTKAEAVAARRAGEICFSYHHNHGRAR